MFDIVRLFSFCQSGVLKIVLIVVFICIFLVVKRSIHSPLFPLPHPHFFFQEMVSDLPKLQKQQYLKNHSPFHEFSSQNYINFPSIKSFLKKCVIILNYCACSHSHLVQGPHLFPSHAKKRPVRVGSRLCTCFVVNPVNTASVIFS